MSPLKKLALWAAQKAATYGGVQFSLTDHQKLSSVFGMNRSHAGKSVTENAAMGVTTVWACTRLLSETMGAMPSGIFRYEKSGNATKVDDHSLYEILIEQPNSDMNGLEAREARTANLALHGNSYSIIDRRGSGDVVSLYPVPTRSVQPKRDESTNWQLMYGIPDRGKVEWYPAEKIWHTKLFSFNGIHGLSPIAYAREAMGLALAGEEFNARLFGNGLMPSARISIPQWLTTEQRVIANDKLQKMHAGLENMQKGMLLEGGMTVESGLISPDDAQFLQLRQFTVIELCRLMGIKPHMVASLEQATNNNIEQLSLEFVMYSMMPYMRREEMAARKLFKPADRSQFFYRYNADGLLRADSAARAQLYSIMLQNGVFTRNEVRALENRNRSEADGMDEFSVQLNMTLVQFLEQMANRNAQPTQGAKQ